MAASAMITSPEQTVAGSTYAAPSRPADFDARLIVAPMPFWFSLKLTSRKGRRRVEPMPSNMMTYSAVTSIKKNRRCRSHCVASRSWRRPPPQATAGRNTGESCTSDGSASASVGLPGRRGAQGGLLRTPMLSSAPDLRCRGLTILRPSQGCLEALIRGRSIKRA